MACIAESEEGVRISVRLQPKASSDAILGIQDEYLRIRVTAAPVDGRANEALCAVVAKFLNVPKRSVRLVSGERSRHKVLEVLGKRSDEIRSAFTTGIPETST